MLRGNLNRCSIIFRGFSTPSVVAIPEVAPEKGRIPILTCKRKEFDLYQDKGFNPNENAKFGSIPLASSGWHHYKSKTDFILIHPLHLGNNWRFSSSGMTFAKLGIRTEISKLAEELYSITRPSVIQEVAIPEILKGFHTTIAAETGCGKTLAYLLPIIERIIRKGQHQLKSRSFNTPLVLIISPSRELALQIGEVAEKLCEPHNLKVKTLVGGNTKQKMMNPTFEDIDILVGTLGVINKLTATKIYRMGAVREVVLDEADTLLDDSFSDRLSYFLQRFSFHKNLTSEAGVQLIMVSATIPVNRESMLEKIIDVSVVKNIQTPDLHRIVPNVPQKFLRMSKINRPPNLLSIAKSAIKQDHSVLVFGNKTPTANFVSHFLTSSGVDCISLNADMPMSIRMEQFERFRRGEVKIMSTTDIGSRGLDTRHVSQVVNFDFPLHMADYIHRCGRTGRLGGVQNCTITNFVSSLHELKIIQQIEHAARTRSALPNVDGNITNIIRKKIITQMRSN
ncbi:probable ATP-dependent RNA helicase DDX28 [Phlebotomus argentipes]|uniref:probable ATP-dependent RNA helicase DDX28 n=1 Tax=Phlebotomus argentipes TaxID=94469 RepID=UPI0028937D3E|nr:probable ATP-dependent RNA helicase DDX28 [Phlebotomus argentipes]